MATKRSAPRRRRPPPERRVDVTRLEYQSLFDLVERHRAGIRRLEQTAATQLHRTVEQQAELEALEKAVFKK